MQTERITRSYTSLLIAVIVVLFYGCGTERSKEELSDILRTYIDTLKNISPVLDGKRIYNPDIITKLYEKDGMHPSVKWTGKDNISQMISSIRNASQDGLSPDDYHLSEIEKLTEKKDLADNGEIKEIARLDLLLTDAFLLLASHIAEGKTDPKTIYPQWNISRRRVIPDWDNFIDSTLKSNNVTGALQNLIPRHREYFTLKKALSEYRRFEENGGWPPFTTNLPKLERGLRHPDVSVLRNRLAITQGQIGFIPGEEDLFDEILRDQVIIFQKRNGLDPDGVVGRTTIEALNITVKDRIETIEANLERWRWLSDDLGKCYIKVNIADFSLQVIKDDKQVLKSLAVVGGPYKQTPVFSSQLKYLVLNPEWVIPTDILKQEIIPSIIKNPAYLAKNNMKILHMDGTEVDSSSISWNNVDTANFPYMIRQESGPQNALGRIAFMFPNEYSVYIHDTPFPYLFFQNDRALSHGCVRINKALELAEYLIRDSYGWDSAHLQTAIDNGKKQIILLKNPIPVHILYLTAWAYDEGATYFAKDVYFCDELLISALKQMPSKQGKQLNGSGYISEPVSVIPGNSPKKRDIPRSAVPGVNMRELFW